MSMIRKRHETVTRQAELLESRRQHGELVEETSDAAGVKRHRHRLPFEYLWARDLLTDRQYCAARELRDTWELAEGVRQPANPDQTVRTERTPDGYSHLDAVLDAGACVAKIRAAVQALGPGRWEMVDAVVIRDRSVTEMAGSKRAADRRPYMLALKAGLDVVGDSLSMGSDYLDVQVWVDGTTVIMSACEDAGGVWRSRSLDRKPWVAESAKPRELYRLAKEEMRRRWSYPTLQPFDALRLVRGQRQCF